MIGSILNILDEVIFPKSCAICGVSGIGAQKSLCAKCEESEQNILSIKSDYSPTDRAIFWDRAYSLFNYNANVARLVHLYKSGSRIDLGRHFALGMYKVLTNLPVGIDVIVPVPSSKSKAKERGFHPSEKLAQNLQKFSGICSKKIIKEKLKHNEQKKLAVCDRHIRSIGRFKLSTNSDISGKNVLLVDDVITTGSTINECARLLKKKGAQTVFSLTIARVDDRKLKV